MRNAELMGQVPGAALPPVLCYHRVGGPLELGVTRIARSTFARQMKALARAGWRTLTLAEFSERVTHPASRIPHPEFLLSFDDGYASLAEHVYPLLADVGFTATTFLVTDYVGRMNTWDVRYTWHRLAHLDWDAIGRWQARGERLAGAAGYELGFGGVRGNGSPLALARLPVYIWDVGRMPLGLREDGLGWLGRAVAHAANRAAVGTSVMLKVLGSRERGAVPSMAPSGTAPRSPLPL